MDPAVCCCCARPANGAVSAVRSAGALLWRPARLALPLCEACLDRSRRQRLFDVALFGAEIGAAALCYALVVIMWPFGPAGASSVAAGLGSLVVLLGARVLRAMVPSAALLGRVPGVWVLTNASSGSFLAGSVALRDALVGRGFAMRASLPTRRLLGAWALAGLVVGAVGIPFFAYDAAYPVVRLVDLEPAPLEIFVDGRSLGVVVGVTAEDPSALRQVRVPVGVRTFEARKLDGSVVDKTTVRVEPTGEQLYAPARGEQCFWVEERAYGQVGSAAVRVLPISPGRSFVGLSERIDAWFEPNPATSADGRWFSGGRRRAFRHGPCTEAPGRGR